MTEPAALTVLLVDDDSALRMMFSALLEAAGFSIAGQAADGQEAVDLYRETRPDIVLMDLKMPGMDGFEALKRMKEEDAGTVVIMLTGVRDQTPLQDCINAGAVGYIRKDKPFTNLANTVQGLYQEARH